MYRLLDLNAEDWQPSGRFYSATATEHYGLLQMQLTKTAKLLQPSAWATQPQQDFTVTDRTGAARQLRLQCLPTQYTDGNATTLVCSLQDMTAQPPLAAVLPHLGKLALVGKMTSAAVHETKNMLGIIIGHLSSINPAKVAADDAIRLAIEQSNDAAARAAQLTDSLLSLARHQNPVPGAALAIDSVIQNLMPTIQLMLGPNIAVELSLTAGDTLASIDKSIFECCLLNLVANSRDAMPQGGKLFISTLRKSPAAPSQGQPKIGFVELTVLDTGIGMSLETQQRCLEPFFTTKSEGKGTGLGLSLLNKLLTQSGGHLSIESKLGLGTTARLFMASATSKQPKSHQASLVQAPTTKPIAPKALSILFVDDEPSLRKLAERVLCRSGHSVTVAASATEARQRLEQGRFDMVISDLNLGGPEDGLSLVRLAQVQQPEAHLVVISGQADDLQTMCSAIPAAFLPKPFSAQQLLKACTVD
jgi:signal transduction histidine kinase/CheY-like chemotaxis protein